MQKQIFQKQKNQKHFQKQNQEEIEIDNTPNMIDSAKRQKGEFTNCSQCNNLTDRTEEDCLSKKQIKYCIIKQVPITYTDGIYSEHPKIDDPYVKDFYYGSQTVKGCIHQNKTPGGLKK